MKKLLLLIAVTLLVLTGCSSSGNGNKTEAGENFTIRVPLLGSDTNFVNQSYAEFKKNIEEKSDGRIKVEIYGSGTLAASEEQQMDLVSDGSAELTSIATGIITNHAGVNGFGIFDVPFLFNSDEKMYKYLDSELIKEIYADLESKRDVKVVGAYDMKGYNLFNNVRKIESPEDMKGLKLRTSPIELQIDLLKELGASPTPLAYSETFTALQQGTIDGLHIANALGWTDKFYEASKYLTLSQHVGLVHIIMVNEEFLNSLPDDLQEILNEELDNLVTVAREQGTVTNEKALEEMKAAGVEVTELTEEQFDVFRDSSKKTIQKAIDVVGQEQYDKVIDLINE